MAYPPLTGLFAERYLIERELGHGATAVVYLAHDKKHDRQIALKVLSKDLAHALGPERFLREIHMTSRLHHPHILPIFDSGEWNGMLYYVLPFVSGESLRENIDREKQLPIEECVRITCEVADALAHAHAHKIVHRDVKPENIMLSDGHALLADFGIARALDVHTGERLTSSGLIVGTSAYMSPEQAAGEAKIDARSDIYSLACVLYEMIAGVQAFTGPTTQSVIAQRFKHKPRPVSTYRPEVPEYIERALEKALAISPADRYSKIKDFSDDLSDTPLEIRDRRRAPLRRAIYGKQKIFGFFAAALVLATAAAVIANPPGHWRSLFSRRLELDSLTYVVAPALSDGKPGFTAQDLAAASALYREMGKWSGVKLVDEGFVQDALHEKPALSNPDLFALGAAHGAGRVIRIDGTGDATLYDVRTGAVVRSVADDDTTSASKQSSRVVYRLLGNSSTTSAVLAAEGLTHSLKAWTLYGDAHDALAAGNFESARQLFGASATADPDFGPPVLWQAEVTEWLAPDSLSLWGPLILRARGRASALKGRDSVLASALASLAEQRYPEACNTYRKIAAADGTDFAAWFGVGECELLDSVVIRSGASGSGWSFRSSFNRASRAFAHAASVASPNYGNLVFGRLQKILFTSSNKIRGGVARAPDTLHFAAYPGLSADTLSFVPYPASVFGSGLPSAATATRSRALVHNFQVLQDLANAWTQRAPNSADAFEALAVMMEANGDIGSGRSGAASITATIARARSLSQDASQRLRLFATDVRLRAKRGDFFGATRLADSVLAMPAASESDAAELAAVAALTGRLRSLSRWTYEAGIPSTMFGEVRVPPAMKQTAATFFATAALGVCGSGTDSLEAQLESQLKSYARYEERSAVRALVEDRPLSFLAPCANAASALRIEQPTNRLYRIQQAVARKQRAVVRNLLDSTQKRRQDLLPGEISLDYTFQEAWAAAAIGDTAAAAASLDLVLNALPSISAIRLREPGASAALGRAFAFRAELAAARGDRATARLYSRSLLALWAHADPDLKPVLDRMTKLANR
jgi:eukaryotic-like serine/threonine-protein kinase